MSITSLNKNFDKEFKNFIICDFVIDSDDAKIVYNSSNIKFNFMKPVLKINIIKFDEDVHNRISSFVLSDGDLKDLKESSLGLIESSLGLIESSWELIDKIEIDACQLLILPEDVINDELDNWLESNIKMNELYKVEEDGKICMISGFGPGVYRLMGIKDNDIYKAIKMEFIKENV